MKTILIAVKFLLYSTIGYYIEAFVGRKENVFRGPIFLFYGLFGLFAIFSNKLHVIYLFILGITWGILVNIFLETIDYRLKSDLNIKYFGILNIVNVLLLEDFFDWFILSSSMESIVFLFIFGVSIFIIDIAITLRKIL